MFYYIAGVLADACVKYRSPVCGLLTLICISIDTSIILLLAYQFLKVLCTYEIHKCWFGEENAAKHMFVTYVKEEDFDIPILLVRVGVLVVCCIIFYIFYDCSESAKIQQEFVARFSTELGQYLADKLGWMVPYIAKKGFWYDRGFMVSIFNCIIAAIATLIVFPYKFIIGVFWYIRWKRLRN